MPANYGKIVEIIFGEIETLEERCPAYHLELKDVVSDIITAERQNRVARININQKVSDKINAAGQFLAHQRAK